MPYQRAPRPPKCAAHAAQCARAVHVIPPAGEVLRAGRASLYVLGSLGWRRAEAIGSRRPLVWLVEAGYGLVARHRPFFARFLFRRER